MLIKCQDYVNSFPLPFFPQKNRVSSDAQNTRQKFHHAPAQPHVTNLKIGGCVTCPLLESKEKTIRLPRIPRRAGSRVHAWREVIDYISCSLSRAQGRRRSYENRVERSADRSSAEGWAAGRIARNRTRILVARLSGARDYGVFRGSGITWPLDGSVTIVAGSLITRIV